MEQRSQMATITSVTTTWFHLQSLTRQTWCTDRTTTRSRIWTMRSRGWWRRI